jgi:low temperature requirement protein LtrA
VENAGVLFATRPPARPTGALPGATLAPVLLVVAGFVNGSAQLALWAGALAILYLGPLVGHMRGFRVSPEHFVERFGLIIIIALGESIIAIGVGAAGLPLDAGVIAAALLGITVAACLWWSYFDWVRCCEQTGEREWEDRMGLPWARPGLAT